MDVLRQISKKKKGRKSSAEIYDYLRRYIKNKPPGQNKLPPIVELSKQIGANYRTVRAALNKLKDEGLVLYEQNTSAVINTSGFDSEQVDVKMAIAYIRWEGNAFCTAISEGVGRFCRENNGGHDLVILDAMKSHKRLLEGLLSISQVVDGILMMPFEVSGYRKELQILADNGTRMVFLDRIVPGVNNVSSVTCDDFGGAYQAVSHLLDVHKRPVYYLGQTDAPSSVRNRYLGWLEAMNEHGYMTTDPYCVPIKFKEYQMSSSRSLGWSKSIEFAGQIFDSHQEDIYCVFGSNDYTAISVYKAAAQRGLEISRDVFVAGFGNMPLSRNSTPKLTTVEQNPEQLGYEGAQLLYEKIAGNIKKPIHQILPVKTIIRQSSVLCDN